jgi:hypothetical protein
MWEMWLLKVGHLFEVGEKSDQTLKPLVTKCLVVNYDETQDCCQVYFVTPLVRMDELQIRLKVNVNMFIMAQWLRSKLKKVKHTYGDGFAIVLLILTLGTPTLWCYLRL